MSMKEEMKVNEYTYYMTKAGTQYTGAPGGMPRGAETWYKAERCWNCEASAKGKAPAAGRKHPGRTLAEIVGSFFHKPKLAAVAAE